MDKKVQDMVNTAVGQYLDFGHSIIVAALFSDFLSRRDSETQESIKRNILGLWQGRMDEIRKNDQEVLASNPDLPVEVRKEITETAEEAINRATIMFKSMIQVYDNPKPAE